MTVISLGFGNAPQYGMHGAPQRTVAPSPITGLLDLFKEDLDLGQTDDDTQDNRFQRLLNQATEQVESDSRRVFMPQTWQVSFDYFPPNGVELYKLPVRAVNFVKYITGGVLTTLAADQYQTDLITEPARIWPVRNKFWPFIDLGTMNAVQVEWTAGYASASLIPQQVIAAILYAARQNYYGCEIGDNYWSLIERIKPFGYIG